jgi:membrane-bound lytic murein transglycosylase D
MATTDEYSRDKTVPLRVNRLYVEVRKGQASKTHFEFDRSFSVGRDQECDLQIVDRTVSSNHLQVFWEQGKWWLADPGSKNGTYINGEKLSGRAELPLHQEVCLARDGPVLVFSQWNSSEPPKKDRHRLTRMFNDAVGAGAGPLGERTRLFVTLWQEGKARHRQRLLITASVLSTLLVASLILLGMNIAKRNRLEQLAEDTFYAAKRTELALAEMQRIARVSGNPAAFERVIRERQVDWRASNASYGELLRELGMTKEELPAEDWLIYRIARILGECEIRLPDEFKETVKDHIRKWRNRRDYSSSIRHTLESGQAARIIESFMDRDLPPQYFYLGLQESLFDTTKVGPPTRCGYAKGMWQFIPTTARAYGMKIGELASYDVFDRNDERHNFEKSTEAAAQYVRNLYDTLGQGSGLLVMACYNWGEEKVMEEIRKMPRSPEKRNFWKLLKHRSIPKETYGYVYSIVAAAVIGENPRLFGLDLENPLEVAQKQVSARKGGGRK